MRTSEGIVATLFLLCEREGEGGERRAMRHTSRGAARAGTSNELAVPTLLPRYCPKHISSAKMGSGNTKHTPEQYERPEQSERRADAPGHNRDWHLRGQDRGQGPFRYDGEGGSVGRSLGQ